MATKANRGEKGVPSSKVVSETERQQSASITGAIRSVEHFNHFRCGACNGWWGIGDAPVARKDWFCPWCGKKNVF